MKKRDTSPAKTTEDKIENILDVSARFFRRIINDKPDYHGSVTFNFKDGGLTHLNEKKSIVPTDIE